MLNQSVGYVYSSENFNALPPSQRLHLILLGADNIAKSRAFYESLGWIKSPTGHDEFVKFDLGGYALCLLSREALAADSLADAKTQQGFNGIAFVYLAKNSGRGALYIG